MFPNIYAVGISTVRVAEADVQIEDRDSDSIVSVLDSLELRLVEEFDSVLGDELVSSVLVLDSLKDEELLVLLSVEDVSELELEELSEEPELEVFELDERLEEFDVVL
ncbi:hypothetical protein MKZ38_006211 [Zalerion maritima]|uniref:Uncharacterized protein n=1 Tax=Zalerion maritima TaxID=339359 RepID=A0AAD5WPS6_9PEZI|nr:hypothetical protein MKZ38_006211 [Zalerion maritima]